MVDKIIEKLEEYKQTFPANLGDYYRDINTAIGCCIYIVKQVAEAECRKIDMYIDGEKTIFYDAKTDELIWRKKINGQYFISKNNGQTWEMTLSTIPNTN